MATVAIHAEEQEDMLRWCPATLISRHFTPTKDAGTSKAKTAVYWLVHGSVCMYVSDLLGTLKKRISLMRQ